MTNQERKEARRMLDMLRGRGAYNTPANICFGDAHFARSIEEKFGWFRGLRSRRSCA